MENIYSNIALQLGIHLWALAVLLLWSVVWKLIAMWKSARHDSLVWFIVFAVVNTAGILEILYIFIFSKMGRKKVLSIKRRGKSRRKRR